MTRIVRPVESHPVPFEQEEIDELWEDESFIVEGEPPSVDEAHEEYTETITEYGEWVVFRPEWPFSAGTGVIIWNREFGEGFEVEEGEGEWHSFVNLFAAVVEQEGDCREADYSTMTLPSGCVDQQCEDCGQSWTVG